MSIQITLSPSGRLELIPANDGSEPVSAEIVAELDLAFNESSANGLLQLAELSSGSPLPPTLVYWREFTQQFFHAACLLGEELLQSWDELPPPTSLEFEQLIASVPPMRGGEYLTTEVLARLWDEVSRTVRKRIASTTDGPHAYLRRVAPFWNLLGKVTFHLAENKRDERRPFAFLATYTHTVGRGAKLQHLPLAQAIKESVGAKNQSRLALLLEPVRRAAEGSPVVKELLESKALFQPQAWSISQAHRFLKEASLMESAGVVLRLPDWWRVRRPPRPQVQVRLGEKQASTVGLDGILEFQVELALDGDPLSAKERRQLLKACEGLIFLRGKWVEVDQQQLQQALTHWETMQDQHPDGLSFIQGMRMLAGAPIDVGDEGNLTGDWSQVVAGDWLERTLKTLRNPTSDVTVKPGTDLKATLRPYQVDGVRWLWFLIKLRLGACLADDMGLGKTIQVIDLLLQLKRERGRGAAAPHLLIVPSSLVGNWKQELQRFGPTLKTTLLHRSECDRETLDQIAAQPQKALAASDLVVTTYGLARRSDWLRQVSWGLVVLDEAQGIKNAGSAQTKAVKKLSSEGRIVLTGTPVENHLGDLWSLFDFCNPGLLGSMGQFKKYVKQLNQRQDAGAYGPLRRLVRPYILRRMKTDPDIISDLPDKTEMRVECGLTKRQVVLYEKAVADLAKRLEKAESMARRGLVLAVLMQLKQICNHPAQYLGESAFVPGDSGKLQRLELICEPIIERQEKMLVFTQFQSICEPLAEYLSGLFGRTGLVLSGKTPVKKRSELVQQFQAEGGPPFFVISVKAGGSGLNLTAASHVIHFDRWWNPAVENQATDRAFRIGQKRNVLVHKFVCRGTVEEKIDQMIRDKRDLADKLLDQSAETVLTEMSDDELLSFVAISLDRASSEE